MDDRVAIELTLNRPRAHAEYLVPMLSDTLRYGGLESGDVDVIAVSSGPGSYTGLRIGASTAKGFAAAVDAQIVEVPSLEALAFGARSGLSEGDVLVAAFDARRDEVFAAAFTIGSRLLVPLRPTSAVPKGEMGQWLGNITRRIVVVGDGGQKMQNALVDSGCAAEWLPEQHPGAAAVAFLGAARFARGQTADVAAFEPHYLKEFVAKTPSATAFEKLHF